MKSRTVTLYLTYDPSLMTVQGVAELDELLSERGRIEEDDQPDYTFTVRYGIEAESDFELGGEYVELTHEIEECVRAEVADPVIRWAVSA